MLADDLANRIVAGLKALDVRTTATALVFSGGRQSISGMTTKYLPLLPLFRLLKEKDAGLDAALGAVPYPDALMAQAKAVQRLQQLEGEQTAPVFSPQQQAFLETHIPCVDHVTGEQFLWSAVDRRPSQINFRVFQLKFKGKARDLVDTFTRIARIVYDPYRGTKTHWKHQVEGQGVVGLNAFRPPVWYKKDYSQTKVGQMKEAYPELFISILKWLIPEREHQSIFLDWLCLAVFDRPTSMLLLRGIRGNGKTKMKEILYHLIGTFHEALEEVSMSFNADLRQKRVIGMDDNPVIGTHKGEVMRKKLTNATLSYNEKNVQTKITERQYASFIICSNPKDLFVVHHDERKLVSPTLSDYKMEGWASEEIFAWLRVFETADELASEAHIDWLRTIGEALLVRYTRCRPAPNIELKSGYFWQDVLRSLTAFKRHIMERLLFGDLERGVDYELEQQDYAMGNRGHAGKIDHWETIVLWLQTDMTWHGHKVISRIDNERKVIYANPAIRPR